MSDKCFISNLIHHLRSYIKGYHLCQLTHNEKLPPKQLNNYMLIYVKVLKSSDCLDILYVDAYMPDLHILYIFLQSNQNCAF